MPTDGRTDITKLIVVFRDFTNVPKNGTATYEALRKEYCAFMILTYHKSACTKDEHFVVRNMLKTI